MAPCGIDFYIFAQLKRYLKKAKLRNPMKSASWQIVTRQSVILM